MTELKPCPFYAWKRRADTMSTAYTAEQFERLRLALREPGVLTNAQAHEHAEIVMRHFGMVEQAVTDEAPQ